MFFKPSELLRPACRQLRDAQLPENGAEWLLMDLAGLSKLDIILDESCVTEEMKLQYERAAAQLAAGMPLAHITGFQLFYDRKFIVTPAVLVPRPETEELVAAALEHAGGTAADIGTGSGCIAITLALESDMEVLAVDISSEALAVARQNALNLNADVRFIEGDLLEPLKCQNLKLDMLISNPPYIAEHEKKLMTASVLDYDPHLALFADDDGLALYKRMVQDLPAVMNKTGIVLFEIGHAQAEPLRDYITAMYPALTIHIEKDINQLDRILWFNWCQ
ncbi:peptide chain release factor N(5)-glutamine methyltransferase [Macrococcus carouselicus]|uniref:Release factor glutamine methyltransferase n=1 Tax=Macrococcus carouselicus TaxID=69969 RepID=A0A9Q8CGK6_9STAP|nr:peptide chain release factor N(5)-glutamine methyltransferase [Macrococcus carouselicus]TDL95409.1 peptide chain release factor N(5)-glutamine methyltransferase [Macrococcus carouselicus]